jgi:hypothetical protein
MEILSLLFGLPLVLVLIEFCTYLSRGRRFFGPFVSRIIDFVSIIGLPVFYLSVLDFGMENDCCSDSATFSPEHRPSIYFMIVLCMSIYFYIRYRKEIAPPFLELVVNSLLLVGIILNIVIAIHLVFPPLLLLGNLPIILLFILALAENQKALVQAYLPTLSQLYPDIADQKALEILFMDVAVKYPILLIICLPILVIISGFLMLFGQQPDAMIRAFTDTYKHGLSQLDHLCMNVHCGGHFLCSVAAKGSPALVKPQRLGLRRGNLIMCNRQLLVANAFEELIEQNYPRLHRLIRNNYNRVGNIVHRHYSIFNMKWVANMVYILMKPLEWCFLFALYCFDRKPEDRIAQQYLDWEERAMLKKAMNK